MLTDQTSIELMKDELWISAELSQGVWAALDVRDNCTDEEISVLMNRKEAIKLIDKLATLFEVTTADINLPPA